MIKKIKLLPRTAVLKLIRLYQKTVSLDHGFLADRYPDGYCRFYPSCSEYSHQAIESRGLLRGGLTSLLRILRCNPFSRGGYDPVKGRKN